MILQLFFFITDTTINFQCKTFIFRFDVSYPAFAYCKRFYNPDRKMVCVTEELSEITEDSTIDSLSTAHFGMLCLYMGGNCDYAQLN